MVQNRWNRGRTTPLEPVEPCGTLGNPNLALYPDRPISGAYAKRLAALAHLGFQDAPPLTPLVAIFAIAPLLAIAIVLQ